MCAPRGWMIAGPLLGAGMLLAAASFAVEAGKATECEVFLERE